MIKSNKEKEVVERFRFVLQNNTNLIIFLDRMLLYYEAMDFRLEEFKNIKYEFNLFAIECEAYILCYNRRIARNSIIIKQYRELIVEEEKSKVNLIK